MPLNLTISDLVSRARFLFWLNIEKDSHSILSRQSKIMMKQLNLVLKENFQFDSLCKQKIHLMGRAFGIDEQKPTENRQIIDDLLQSP